MEESRFTLLREVEVPWLSWSIRHLGHIGAGSVEIGDFKMGVRDPNGTDTREENPECHVARTSRNV